MSLSLEKPWLSKIALDNASRFGQSLSHGGRRVQTFNVKHNPADKSLYKHTCEISDKFEFMRAAFSPKALDKQEPHHATNLEGMIIRVNSFKLMLYTGTGSDDAENAVHRKKNKQKQKRSKISRLLCPARIASAGAPQIWLIISDFTCLGGAENDIFGEPVYIKRNPEIASLIERLLLANSKPDSRELQTCQCGRVQDVTEDRSTAHRSTAHKRLAAQNPSTDTDSVAGSRKRQRRNSGDCCSPEPVGDQPFPTIRQLPFLSDMEAVWSCRPLWQNLIVKHASVRVMYVWNMVEGGVSAHDSEQDQSVEIREQEQPKQQQGAQFPDKRVTKSLEMDHSISSDKDNGDDAEDDAATSNHLLHEGLPALGQMIHERQQPIAAENLESSERRHQPPSAHLANMPKLQPYQSASDLLGDLMISADAGLTSSRSIMDSMYGTISSPGPNDALEPEPSNCDNDADGRYDASLLLQNSLQWNQDSGFSIHR
ncbi:hypothetical protein IWW48_003022 [Coemansia sp. RSA 1200]|nr:hypothetical protein IWW48_003022 [Coemansia sp. RSA 1200]